jgi:hypothetical protein
MGLRLELISSLQRRDGDQEQIQRGGAGTAAIAVLTSLGVPGWRSSLVGGLGVRA